MTGYRNCNIGSDFGGFRVCGRMRLDSFGRVHINRPSRGALLLALIPFIALCFTVPVWGRVDPVIPGIPFNLFGLLACIRFME